MKDLSKFVSVAARRTQMFYTEHLKVLEVRSSQFMFIVYICENAGQTQDELSQGLIMDKSTSAKVLANLEVNGYITKAVNAKDKREFNIFPTDKARAAYPKILEIKDEWHSKMTDGFSDIERDVFEKLMEKAMENAVKHCKY